MFDALSFGGDVLELAPGSGTWTRRLVRTVRPVTAANASPEMVELNHANIRDVRVTYVIASLFAWEPERSADSLCFGFWFAHVPVERLDRFLATVARSLRPGGLVGFADSWCGATALHENHRVPGASAQILAHTLANEQTYQIVKNYHDAASSSAGFLRAGLNVDVRQTATYFQYGVGVWIPHVE